MPRSLFKIVKETLKGPLVADNSIIAFHDNSSAIRGGAVKYAGLADATPQGPRRMRAQSDG